MVKIKMTEVNFQKLKGDNEWAKLGENECYAQLPTSFSAIFNVEHFKNNGLKHCDIIFIGKQIFFIELKNTSNTTNKGEIIQNIFESIEPKYNGSKKILESLLKLYNNGVSKSFNNKCYTFFVSNETISILQANKSIFTKQKYKLSHLKSELDFIILKPCCSNLFESGNFLKIL